MSRSGAIKYASTIAVKLFLVFGLTACTSLQEPTRSNDEAAAAQIDTIVNKAIDPGSEGSKSGHESKPKERIDATRFISFQSDLTDENRVNLDGQYVRLIVDGSISDTGVGDDTADAERKLKRRSAFARALWGKSESQTLVLKIEALGSPVKATIALFAYSGSSGRRGETWSTSITGNTVATPYFLVSGGGAISSKAEFRLSEQTESQVLATAVRVLSEATQTVNPTAKVATLLSAPGIAREADSLDKALGQLFSRTLDEATLHIEPLPRWANGRSVRVKLSIPDPEKDDLNGELVEIGTWTIRLSSPKPSVFSDYEICSDAKTKNVCRATPDEAASAGFENLVPGTILGFQLTDQVSLNDHLTRQAWFSEAISSAAGGNDNKDTLNGLRVFCLKTKATLSALPLSEQDTIAGLWAIMRSGIFKRETELAFNKPETCGTDIQRMKALSLRIPTT